MNSIKEYSIQKYENEKLERVTDSIIIEYLYTIFLDKEQYITLTCTPKSLEELAIGFLHSESIIEKIEDISSIRVYEDKGYVDIELKNRELLEKKTNKRRIITSGCGKGSIYYDELDNLNLNQYYENKKINYSLVTDIMNEFNKKSELFRNTGGVHSVALSDLNEIIFFEEDIGRHNALDKIIGKSIENNIDVKDKAILTSGRITSEIVLKCAKLNINCIISRSAATNVAIDLANILNINLIGFVRGKKMNIYV
ncbi:formate dehydrogenase accessory sulfurtransferase FdhD [Romboutsia sp.]|uniref:formate dehydrogenase accessory sulfurtransferase FdhD n=1 Tax=Romboutsia sp. TaxID=1965302 RepID=UPI003F34D224